MNKHVHTHNTLTRRDLLKGMAAGAVAGLLPASAQAQALDPKFLIVLTATGGASIIDGMLAIRESECLTPDTVNCFPDANVISIPNSPIRAVNLQNVPLSPIPGLASTDQASFVTRHAQDMMVVTHTGTSVNHLIAQKRALTGNDAWAGRTIQELVAERYGRDFPLPNINMSTGGYVEPGIDVSLSDYARAQIVTNPNLLFAGMNGWRGVPNGPPKSLVAIARAMRNESFDTRSVFARTFKNSPALQTWFEQRDRIESIEAADLITKLTPYSDSPSVPLSAYGLEQSPDGERIRSIFPNFSGDPLEAQAALAFLLLKNRAAVTVTIGPGNTPLVDGENVITPPLAFDFSHTNHRAAQGVMWGRLLNVADRLIALLKETPLDANRSFWDRTLIYIASDFGRTRNRTGGQTQFSSGHHLNNGSLLISPMVNGNQILGGVDANTGLTYGFDPVTGQPQRDREMSEREFFGGLCQIMGIDLARAPQPFTDMVAMRRT